jgi:phosphoribosylamine--glycine ligase
VRVVVVGSGGREACLAHVLSRTADVVITPGNPGIPGSVATPPEDLDADLFVIGPEQPLVDGLADRLRAAGKLVFGPGADGAQVEGSKAYMKELALAAGVPTARHGTFEAAEPALELLRSLPPPWVVKTDGLAAGKGVLVTDDLAAAEADVRAKLSGASFGDAGRRVIIEEGMTGPEVSIFAICDGQRAVALAPAQDFKRVGDGDTGPNTGGMGAYSPLMWMEPATYAAILEEIIRPTIHQLALIGAPYSGLLYAGVMITEDGPRALEFNCRFGDPETQVILPRLGTDLLELVIAAGAEDLAGREVVWSADKAVCVVLASEGYPESSSSGDEISGLDNIPAGVYIYHAGTEERDGRFYTAGGRVLDVVGTGPTVIEARARAYAAVEQIHFEGMQYRTDIALEAIDLEDI